MQIALPVVWEVCDTVTIEADSIGEAIELFKETSDHIPLPSNPNYIDGSFALWTEDEDAIKLFNKDRTLTEDD